MAIRHVARRKSGQSEANKQRMLQVVFAAFIDLMCEAVPEDSREQFRNGGFIFLIVYFDLIYFLIDNSENDCDTEGKHS